MPVGRFTIVPIGDSTATDRLSLIGRSSDIAHGIARRSVFPTTEHRFDSIDRPTSPPIITRRPRFIARPQPNSITPLRSITALRLTTRRRMCRSARPRRVLNPVLVLFHPRTALRSRLHLRPAEGILCKSTTRLLAIYLPTCRRPNRGLANRELAATARLPTMDVPTRSNPWSHRRLIHALICHQVVRRQALQRQVVLSPVQSHLARQV
jgi:hypothetical protein